MFVCDSSVEFCFEFTSQIEEQAIAELMEHYQASSNFDEHITVERVPTTLASPTWAATQRQQP